MKFVEMSVGVIRCTSIVTPQLTDLSSLACGSLILSLVRCPVHTAPCVRELLPLIPGLPAILVKLTTAAVPDSPAETKHTATEFAESKSSVRCVL